jgi:glycosyltransferase involved in cell wall biosynthesis
MLASYKILVEPRVDLANSPRTAAGDHRAVRRLSVVVPTYDRLPMLRQALASIRELPLDGVELEIIVGDNGLKPETRAVAEEFGALYAPAYDKGASVARNAALRLATGEFVAFLDDDDVWLPGHIQPHLDHLEAHPEHDAVFGQAIYADPELKPTGDPWPANSPGSGDQMTRSLLSGLFPQIGTVVARRAALDEVGLFNARLIGGEDLDWLLRFARQHKLGYVATPCILFRGRPPGSSDELQRVRIGFDCWVFLRHAIPSAWRLWKSPLGFAVSYHASLIHYHYYFTRKAIWFAQSGSLAGVLKTLLVPLLYVPLLVLAEIVRPTELRKEIGRMFLEARKRSSETRS